MKKLTFLFFLFISICSAQDINYTITSISNNETSTICSSLPFKIKLHLNGFTNDVLNGATSFKLDIYNPDGFKVRSWGPLSTSKISNDGTYTNNG